MQNILHEYKAIRLQTQNTQRDGYTKSQPGANERLRHTTHRKENSMTKLQPENTSRKLDSLGRVVIPKNLRDKYHETGVPLYCAFLTTENTENTELYCGI